MRVWGDRQGHRRSVYSGTAAPRLCLPPRLAFAAALLTALGCAGCSYQLDSVFPKSTGDAELTGSLSLPGTQPAGHSVSEADLAYARAAAADALTRGGKDNNVPWKNPQTGVGGNITPLASAYSQDGVACRDFLASYTSGASQAWLHGSACRTARGAWEVKSLRPLKSG